MIKNILLLFVGIFLIALLVIWLISGGPSKVLNQVQNGPGILETLFGTGSSTGAFSFVLPFQPSTTYNGIDLGYHGYEEDEVTESELTAEEKYNIEQQKIKEAQTFGDPSPYRGKIEFGSYLTEAHTNPGEEYVEIIASSDISAPITITGWSLQSMVSGKRFPIGPGVQSLTMGSVQQGENITLKAGMSALISAGSSPFSSSFRENMCTGYLSQFSSFSPSLNSSCPSASSELPETSQNISAYGASCFTELDSIPSCRTPNSVSPETSTACKHFIQQTLTYNGCADRHRWRDSFLGNTWRIYLGNNQNTWGDVRDVIRLLDSEGRVVDVLSYED